MMDYNEDILKGKDYFSKGNFSSALDCFKKAIQYKPDSKEAHLLEAMAFQNIEGWKSQKALSSLYRILAIDPDDSIVPDYIECVSSGELLSNRIELYPVCYSTSAKDSNYQVGDNEFMAYFIDDITMKFEIIDDNSVKIKSCYYDKHHKAHLIDIDLEEKNETVIIPSVVRFYCKQYTVKEIGEKSFNLEEDGLPLYLTNVVIPNTITKIEENAFLSCVYLKSIRIPKSIVEISAGAFSYCSGLEQIEVEKGNKIYDSRENCNAIIEKQTNKIIAGCKKTKIPSSVKIIGFAAFHGQRGMDSIDIPDSITVIEQSSFLDCGLKTIKLPDSLVYIGRFAFSSCHLRSVIFGNSLKIIDDSAFRTNWNLKSIKIPNSLTSIGQMAFSDCHLKSLILGDSLTSIGDYAFNGHYMFGDNPNSYNIEIPKTVEKIGLSAFCSNNLQSIKVHKDNAYFDSRNDCNAIIEKKTKTLILGCGKTSIPDSIKHIGKYAFCKCESLYEISLPNSIEEIGDYAFSLCRNLYTVTLSESIINIGLNAFNGCENLTKIIIPQNVSYIGENVFKGCKKLRCITCFNPNPPHLQSDFLFDWNDRYTYYDNSAFNLVVLIVPLSSVENYKNAPGWKLFKNIFAIEDIEETLE